MNLMSRIEELLATAAPGTDEEDKVLEALYDSLGNGTPTPNDQILIQRLTLAGVRRIDTRSKHTKTRVDYLWFAMIVLAMTLAAIAVLLAIHTNNFHDLFPTITGFGIGGSVLALLVHAGRHVR
jgi:hypothetical protein